MPDLDTRPVALRQQSEVSLEGAHAPAIEEFINSLTVEDLRQELLHNAPGGARNDVVEAFTDLQTIEHAMRRQVLDAASPEKLDRASTDTLERLAELVGRDETHAERLKNQLESLDSTERDEALHELASLVKARSGDSDLLFEVASILIRDPNLDPAVRRELEQQMAAVAEVVQTVREALAEQLAGQAGHAIVDRSEELLPPPRSRPLSIFEEPQSSFDLETGADGKEPALQQGEFARYDPESRDRRGELMDSLERCVTDASALRGRILSCTGDPDQLADLRGELQEVTLEIRRIEAKIAELR